MDTVSISSSRRPSTTAVRAQRLRHCQTFVFPSVLREFSSQAAMCRLYVCSQYQISHDLDLVCNVQRVSIVFGDGKASDSELRVMLILRWNVRPCSPIEFQ
jgi:hypothetical protein